MAAAKKKKTTARPSPSKKPGAKRVRRTWRSRILLWGLIGAVSLMALIGLLYLTSSVPDPNEITRTQSAVVVDREGRPLGRLSAGADRVSIPGSDMPRNLRNAVIATEDKRFFRHKGVSFISIGRAALVNLLGRDVSQGGSTITQQYVKNAFVGSDRTLLRKTREALIAIKLERTQTKEEILVLYLNAIYFGRGSYGVQAAAQTYFGKDAKKLSLSESATLAGIIRSPENEDPTRHPDRADVRRRTVLKLMREQGYITEADVEKATKSRVKARARARAGEAPHFLEDVRAFLEEELGPRRLYGGGVVVEATLDRTMQRAAEAAVLAVYDKKSDPEAALIAIDPADGGVRAMVGSRDFARRQLNIATQARRQPGSTFKPIVLAAAIEDGIKTTEKYRAPGTITIQTDSGPWRVSNYDKRDRGTLTLDQATQFSVNTVYAQLIMDVGADRAAEEANRLGIVGDLPAFPSLTLGTAEVRPIDLATVYATFAARGQIRTPSLVRSVKDRDGGVLYEQSLDETRAMSPGDADRVNQVLQNVITKGTGGGAAIGRPAAGKTGTTESFRDAWFAGYTPDLAAVVWNGFADGTSTLKDVRGRNVTGGSFPADIWRRFMRAALADTKATKFVAPKSEQPTPSATVVTSPSGDPLPLPTETPTVPPTGEPSSSPSPSPKPSKSASPKPSKSASPSPSPSPSQ